MASTLCPGDAAHGGFGSDTFTSSAGPAPCGTAVTVAVAATTDEAKLVWGPGNPGYPPSLTLGNLGGLDASVSNVIGNDPYFFLSFFENSLAQNNGDQMLLIEFQVSNVVGGNSMPVDPATTLFNLYDNTTGQYYDSNTSAYDAPGQQATHTLAGWIGLYSQLGSDSIANIELTEGLSGGCGAGPCGASVTVNSVSVTTTPEPGTLVSVATGLLSLGSGLAFRRRRVV